MKNLTNQAQRSPEERREIAKKGGTVSGKAKKRKKAMREAAQMILGLKPPEAVQAQLKKMGIRSEDLVNQTALLVAVLNQAYKGDVRAAEFIRDTAGESPNSTTASAALEVEDDPLTKSLKEEFGL